MTALRVENLSVALKGREVLRDVSFSLGGGELIGLIGPNGSGKSTLLKSLIGLTTSSGEISADGRNLISLDPRERARLVGYLPQERDVAWPITALRLVALGRIPHLAPMGDLGARDHAIIKLALEQADATDLGQRVVSELSGGERARVLIARALAQDTPILIADEPTAGLDPAHQIALMEVFSGLARGGRAIVVALHEIALAARWCTRLLLLDHGSLVADGKPRDVLSAEVFEQAYGIRLHMSDSADGLIIQPIERRTIGPLL